MIFYVPSATYKLHTYLYAEPFERSTNKFRDFCIATKKRRL